MHKSFKYMYIPNHGPDRSRYKNKSQERKKSPDSFTYKYLVIATWFILITVESQCPTKGNNQHPSVEYNTAITSIYRALFVTEKPFEVSSSQVKTCMYNMMNISIYLEKHRR